MTCDATTRTDDVRRRRRDRKSVARDAFAFAFVRARKDPHDRERSVVRPQHAARARTSAGRARERARIDG
jgi:hypothetical protein